jgi:hypothetical protein
MKFVREASQRRSASPSHTHIHDDVTIRTLTGPSLQKKEKNRLRLSFAEAHSQSIAQPAFRQHDFGPSSESKLNRDPGPRGHGCARASALT